MLTFLYLSLSVLALTASLFLVFMAIAVCAWAGMSKDRTDSLVHLLHLILVRLPQAKMGGVMVTPLENKKNLVREAVKKLMPAQQQPILDALARADSEEKCQQPIDMIERLKSKNEQKPVDDTAKTA